MSQEATTKTICFAYPMAIARLRAAHPYPPTCPDVPVDTKPFWLEKGNTRLLRQFIPPDLADDPRNRDRPKVYVEFGSWKGRSAKYILSLNTKCVLVCVDTWALGDTSIGANKAFVHADPDHLYKTFLRNTWAHRDRLIPVRMDGRKAMAYLKAMGLRPDLIYLDMDHSYKACRGDLDALMTHFPQTLILGDDVMHWPGVARAVKEVVDEYEVHRLVLNQNCYALVPAAHDRLYDFRPLPLHPLRRPSTPAHHRALAIVVPVVSTLAAAQVERCLARLRAVVAGLPPKLRAGTTVYVVRGTHGRQSRQRRRTQGGAKPTTARRTSSRHNQRSTRRRASQPTVAPILRNRGWLANVGCHLVRRDGHTVVALQDPEWLPDDALAAYYAHYPLRPLQLGYRTPGYTYEKWYVGSLLTTLDDVERLNGYPNHVTGWPGWDAELLERAKSAAMALDVPAAGANVANGKGVRLLPDAEAWRAAKRPYRARALTHSATWRHNGLAQAARFEVVRQRETNGSGVREAWVRQV